MPVDERHLVVLQRALEPLPTVHGGTAIAVAAPGPPPSMAVLCTGDVCLDGEQLRIALHAGASAARNLGGSCVVLVPAVEGALRVLVDPAKARDAGALVLIEGAVGGIRPTAEPPWSLSMRFHRTGDGDTAPFLDYWRQLRTWLEGGARGAFPGVLPDVNR